MDFVYLILLLTLLGVLFSGVIIIPWLCEKHSIEEQEYLNIPEYKYLKNNIKVGTTLIQDDIFVNKKYIGELYVVNILDSDEIKVVDSNKKIFTITYRKLYKNNFKIVE